MKGYYKVQFPGDSKGLSYSRIQEFLVVYQPSPNREARDMSRARPMLSQPKTERRGLSSQGQNTNLGWRKKWKLIHPEVHSFKNKAVLIV